ncbi:hypothetical protein Tco_0525413 [Tanacetum coccineum]
MSHHKKIFVNPFHTNKFFANMKRAGKDFSGRITPLLDTIMVQASKEVGGDSDHPTDSNQIPIVDQPSTSFQPKQKQKYEVMHPIISYKRLQKLYSATFKWKSRQAKPKARGNYFQIKRVDESSKRYSSMIRLLQGIDREDLQTLWKLVKTKHGDKRPEDGHERVFVKRKDFKEVMLNHTIRIKYGEITKFIRYCGKLKIHVDALCQVRKMLTIFHV